MGAVCRPRAAREEGVVGHGVRQDVQHDVERQRAHVGVRLDRGAVLHFDALHAPVPHAYGPHAFAEPELSSLGLYVRLGRLTGERREADPGYPHRRVRRLLEQRLAEDHEHRPGGDVAYVVVQRRKDDQVPEVLYSPFGLMAAAQPFVAGLAVEAVSVLHGVGELHREQRVHGPELVHRSHVRVSDERREQVELPEPRGAGQHAPDPVSDDLGPQPVLDVRLVYGPYLSQVVEIVPVAAEEDVLAVVDLYAGLRVAEREGPAAQERPLFDQGYAESQPQQPPGGREPGQTSAKDGYRPRSRAAGIRLSAHSLAMRRSFSVRPRPMRSAKTSKSARSIRSRMRL